MKKHFSEEEEAEMTIKFKNEERISVIAQKFGYSYGTMRRFLEKNIENYKEIAKKHRSEACRIHIKKWQEEHPEELKEIGRKIGKLPRTPFQIETFRETGRKTVHFMHESNAKNNHWVSNPEVLFYITCLSKNFFLKDIKPQYYIKEIKHRVDFAIPSQKLLFEVDGDYHHGYSGDLEKDKKAKARDAEIDNWAKDNGWTIFRYNDEKLRKFGIRL